MRKEECDRLQKYIPYMEVIKRCHRMEDALPCIEFDYSINPCLGYWYAEERCLKDLVSDYEGGGIEHERCCESSVTLCRQLQS